MSVIVPAMLGYGTVLAALDAWEVQTCRSQLEILILCPTVEEAGPLTPGQVVIPTGSLRLHEARARGIRAAQAGYVMIAEDHCLPDPGWAQAVLDRLTKGWDAVGPAMRSGNPRTAWAEAAFLLAYGEWMTPLVDRTNPVLPGNNTVLLRRLLVDLGLALEEELLIPAFLTRRLQAGGLRFYLEDGVTMRHYDPPHWKKQLRVFGCVGMGFGAMRTRRWPRIARALYPLGAALVAGGHWWRAWRHYGRAGARAGLRALCLGPAFILAWAWAWGECLGALRGVARVAPRVWMGEVKP